jgi:undecaprenyl phosphate-alpha-L-ara4FN deformylase
MRVALKVDVSTLRGTLEGVPALLRLFDVYRARATFFFSLGPDHTGRGLGRLLDADGLREARRTSAIRRCGLKDLLYGTLLPGPDIGWRGRAVMRSCAQAGHEVGIRAYDTVQWHRLAAGQRADWTRREMGRAAAAFEAVFGWRAEAHGAAGWQVNPHVLALEARMGLRYASDTRGRSAFYPMLQGVRSVCPQIPTTLPTLDELVGRDGVTLDNVHEYLYAESQYLAPQGHVYSLGAEIEGLRLLPVMEKLLVMWRASSGGVGPLGEVYSSLDLERLPHHLVGWGRVPGRCGYLATQGQPVSD